MDGSVGYSERWLDGLLCNKLVRNTNRVTVVRPSFGIDSTGLNLDEINKDLRILGQEMCDGSCARLAGASGHHQQWSEEEELGVAFQVFFQVSSQGSAGGASPQDMVKRPVWPISPWPPLTSVPARASFPRTSQPP